MARTVRMRVPSLVKSTPWPGTRVMAEIMSAVESWPCARSPASTCSWSAPAGRERPTTPAKITPIARPSTRGAHTPRTTETTTARTTTVRAALCGVSSFMSRAAEAQNCCGLRAGSWVSLTVRLRCSGLPTAGR